MERHEIDCKLCSPPVGPISGPNLSLTPRSCSKPSSTSPMSSRAVAHIATGSSPSSPPSAPHLPRSSLPAPPLPATASATPSDEPTSSVPSPLTLQHLERRLDNLGSWRSHWRSYRSLTLAVHRVWPRAQERKRRDARYRTPRFLAISSQALEAAESRLLVHDNNNGVFGALRKKDSKYPSSATLTHKRQSVTLAGNDLNFDVVAVPSEEGVPVSRQNIPPSRPALLLSPFPC
mgnify:CR=1 FL=1